MCCDDGSEDRRKGGSVSCLSIEKVISNVVAHELFRTQPYLSHCCDTSSI